jgi:Zn-dependent protease
MGFDVTYLIVVIVVVIISMTFHEAMHAYVSYWLGDDTAKLMGRLTLNPIKHLDPFMSILLPVMLAISGAPVFGGAKPVPFNPNNVKFNEWGIAIVAAAGPLTNLLIAFLMSGLWILTGFTSVGLIGTVFSTAVSVNLGFFLFNLIPIPPLDGSRIIYALAPEFVRRGMEAMERLGVMLVFIMILFAGSALNIFITNGINFFFNIFMQIFTALKMI